MGAGSDIRLLNERILTDRARHGDRAAFDELAHRHLAAAWGLAGAVTRHPGLAVDAVVAGVAGALADPHDLPRIGTESALIPLLRATRHAALDGPTDPTRELSGVVVDAPVLDDRAVLVREAFHDMPERSRSALWLIEVERLEAPVAAGALELCAADLSTLVDRARHGLAEQLLRGGLRAAAGTECSRTIDRLPDYMADELSERDVVRVRRHLDGCERCRDRVAALDDLIPLLRQCTVAMPVALVDDARRRWAASIVPVAGPLGLTLPSGRPLPVWMERALAGTAAAVVTLGITGALIASGGRGSKVREDVDHSAATAEATISAGDGESALGDVPELSELELDSGTPITVPGPAGAGSSTMTTPRRSSGSGAADAARGRATLPPMTAAAPPATTPPATVPLPTTPPTTVPPATTPPPPPPPPPPPAPESMVQIDVGVGPILGISLGDQCTGVTVLGTTLGCDNTSGAPLEIGLGGILFGNGG